MVAEPLTTWDEEAEATTNRYDQKDCVGRLNERGMKLALTFLTAS